jgi:hypothetical protein
MSTVGERTSLARQAQKHLKKYASWTGRDEDKAYAELLEARADLVRLVSLVERDRSKP